MSEDKLHMKVSLGTIDDLGVKLYSGFPAALAELVANAWDADATRVDIDTSNDKVVITDNGHGMSRDDIQNKYLTVGYRRRDHDGEEKTPEHKRAVMGRKGIGRLALFSIANQIKVHSVKNGEKIGLVLSYEGIQDAIKVKETYYPPTIDKSEIEIDCGTKIELTDFRHQPRGLEKRLKERISRRFSIIGGKYKFTVFVNKTEISVSDRNYYSQIQELWTFGDAAKTKETKEACEGCKHRPLNDKLLKNNKLSGWIGAVSHSSQLKDDSGENLNNIVIMMRGRLAQEDILHSLGKGDLAVKYLIGEIHADYLDEGEEDMATSGRQNLNQNDSRYKKIKEDIQNIVTYICKDWHNLRTTKASKDILRKNKEIKEWYEKLGRDAKKITDRLFKDTISIDDEERKNNLIRCIVPAVEQMKMRSNLDALNNVSLDNLEQFSEIFNYQDDIEAMSYYTITEGRLKVINKLSEYVEKQEIEKIIQKHIYDHLWLLDPSWDRACTESHIEKQVKKRWKKIDSKSNKEIIEMKKLRLDIQYKKTSGQHIVIELKRPGRQLDHHTLAKQITSYMDAVSDELKNAQEKDDTVEGIIILGELPTGWSNSSKMEKSKKSLQQEGIRVTTYQEIILRAERQYKDYIEAQKETSDKIQWIESLMKSVNA